MSGSECEEWCVFSERFFLCVCFESSISFHFSFTSLRDLQGGWTLLGYLTRVGVAASPQVGANWSRVRIPKGFTDGRAPRVFWKSVRASRTSRSSLLVFYRKVCDIRESMVIKVVVSIYDRYYYRVVSSDKVFQRGAPSFFLSVSFRPEGGV